MCAIADICVLTQKQFKKSERFRESLRENRGGDIKINK